jgi:hypothetical protein
VKLNRFVNDFLKRKKRRVTRPSLSSFSSAFIAFSLSFVLFPQLTLSRSRTLRRLLTDTVSLYATCLRDSSATEARSTAYLFQYYFTHRCVYHHCLISCICRYAILVQVIFPVGCDLTHGCVHHHCKVIFVCSDAVIVQIPF